MADTKLSDLDAVTDVLTTDEYVLARSGTSKKITALNLAAGVGGSGLFDGYAYLRDEKTSGSHGGTSSSGWNTRVLNTEVFDRGAFVSLSSNQFTLDAGTFFVVARTPTLPPASTGSSHKARIRNITDSSDALVGSSQFAYDAQLDAWVQGQFTIAGTKTFELQHYIQSARTTNGLGLAVSASVVEVYAELWIYRETAGV